MRSVTLSVPVAAIVLVVGFLSGFKLGEQAAVNPPIYLADGYVGADQASFQVGDKAYGFESTVPWTDRTGAQYLNGWPECLPQLSEVKGVRFAGTILWHEGVGSAKVTWVDCRDR